MKYRKLSFVAAIMVCMSLTVTAADALKIHGIFRSNMVIQREKPVKIWGWAKAGQKVMVQFGDKMAEAEAGGEESRWEVTFDACQADSAGRKLIVSCGSEKIVMDNILIGDIWVMNGQSNMKFGLKSVFGADLESATAHLPLLRHIAINAGAESEHLEKDLKDHFINGDSTNKNWNVVSPEIALDMGAIGYVFGSRIQQATRIPIGIIDNARGGASLESLVPRHKFKEDPLAAEYLAWVEKRQAEFDWDEAVQKMVAKWEKTVADQRKKGVPEDKLPPKPEKGDLSTWSIPGRSPGDAASCYNGMFGVFKGLNIKGVLFHQGYNNAMGAGTRPKRYRILMKLMVEGWREDFNDEHLPVGVIGFCAGGVTQSGDNFEIWSNSTAAYIREAQRLGLADAGDSGNTSFLPAYDQKIPGLHPKKKVAHGERAARWALNRIYKMKVDWDSAMLVSAERDGAQMVLTFDKDVEPDDRGPVEGFAIAGEDGKFYKAYADSLITKDQGVWGNQYDRKKLFVWSPLVKEPVAVRYAWARSPMGNLKINGMPWQPLHSFRTDAWDFPEIDNPEEAALDRGKWKEMGKEAEARCEYRKTEEAKMAVEILKRLEVLGKEDPGVIE